MIRNTPEALNLTSNGDQTKGMGWSLREPVSVRGPKEVLSQGAQHHSLFPLQGSSPAGDEAWLGHWPQPSLHCQTGFA